MLPEDVIALHDLIIENSGGIGGVRDYGLLEASLGRADQTVFGEELYSDTFEKAAAILESIANHHPFIDGNKRTAMAATGYYLVNVGFKLEISNEEYEDFMLHVVNDRPEVNEIAKWLKKHSKKIKGN